MKICLPTMGRKGLDETIGRGFGKVPNYTIIDTKTNDVIVIENTNGNVDNQHELFDTITRIGVEIVISGGLSQKLKPKFEELGIKIYIGASGTVRRAIQLLKDGKLQEIKNENTIHKLLMV